jgi:N-acetyl-alpha-D-glucosaminyl L-malate synthase BshA
VTAVSDSLRADTYQHLGVKTSIEVIPNFLDCIANRRRNVPGLRARLAPEGQAVFVHVSNFRPVKRAPVVVEVFARVRREMSAKLLMVGDGPDVNEAVRLAKRLQVAQDVAFLGLQEQIVPLLSIADGFILPSSQESFGLAALEALSCEVPVIAARVGGLPEVIDDGVNGFLHAPDDIEGMAASAMRLATDRVTHTRMTAAARRTAEERFSEARIVPIYEAYYAEVMRREPRGYTAS